MRLFTSVPRLSLKASLPSPSIHGDGDEGMQVAQVGKELFRHEENASPPVEKLDRLCVCLIRAGKVNHFLALTPK